MRILKKRGLCGGLKRNRMGNKWIFVLLFVFYCYPLWQCYGENLDENKLCEAIYRSEGGDRTNYPYGIKSVSCETKDECRIKCIESVRNQFKLFTRHGGKGVKNFIREFARRYDSGDSRAGQAIWIKNVTRIYYKQGVLHGRE